MAKKRSTGKKSTKAGKPKKSMPYFHSNFSGPKINAKISAEVWAESNQWVSGASSNVTGMRYEKKAQRLWVSFNSGGGYYSGVQKRIAKMFFDCSSLGMFVHWILKPRYSWTRSAGADNSGQPPSLQQDPGNE